MKKIIYKKFWASLFIFAIVIPYILTIMFSGYIWSTILAQGLFFVGAPIALLWLAVTTRKHLVFVKEFKQMIISIVYFIIPIFAIISVSIPFGLDVSNYLQNKNSAVVFTGEVEYVSVNIYSIAVNLKTITVTNYERNIHAIFAGPNYPQGSNNTFTILPRTRLILDSEFIEAE